MAAIEELIRSEEDGTLSFGNYKLSAKAKAEDFVHAGDLYKVKTFQEITKLEKNGLFTYESVPGTSVKAFCETEEGVSFLVEGCGNVQLTVGLQDDTEYLVHVNGTDMGRMRTNLGGKLSLGVELNGIVKVEIRK